MQQNYITNYTAVMAEQKIEELPMVKALLEHDLPTPTEQQKQLVRFFPRD
jgi:hypothetical protein